jgi:hypothetical protein
MAGSGDFDPFEIWQERSIEIGEEAIQVRESFSGSGPRGSHVLLLDCRAPSRT